MTRAIGILGYGAYVPEGRVAAATLAAAWGRSSEGRLPVTEKSVPDLDEDTITMAIEAARQALARAAGRVDAPRLGAVFVGTESKPYAVKPCGTVVAEAIGAIPWTSAADFEFACKAGTEALRAAAAFVGAGIAEAALAIGMDAAQGKPGDHLEYTAAAGGGAVIVGSTEGALAILEGSISFVTDTPDFFRRQHFHFPEHGHRFTGEPAYFTHVEAASRRLLDELGRKPADYRFAVFHQPNPKFVRRAAAELEFTEAQVGPTAVVDRIGNTYSGASLLGLAAALDRAAPGDRIFVCSYGSGAGSDAFSFVAGEALPAARARAPLLQEFLDRRRPIADYGTYLRRAGAVRTL
ncbi:MAG TPA: hydroxymethylglutaryl-CoA synthase [Dongiaceae bacterium]|nr:hydroxymethylglutaryl-CoA synthase [Dongiaceae bacterium]